MNPSSTLVITAVLLLAGCTWVKVNDAGAGVAQRTAAEVARCEKLGTAFVRTTTRVLVARNPTDVRTELVALARNQAGGMGANAIVPVSEPQDGTQSFDMYRCP